MSIAGECIGDAQSMAIVNQHLCKVHIVAVAEALGLADALGLDMNIVLRLLEKADGGSRMLLDRGPRMLGPTNVKVSSRLDLSQRTANSSPKSLQLQAPRCRCLPSHEADSRRRSKRDWPIVTTAGLSRCVVDEGFVDGEPPIF